MDSTNGRGVKYCPAPDFTIGGVLLEEPFVEVAEVLALGGEPVELVEAAHQGGSEVGFFKLLAASL